MPLFSPNCKAEKWNYPSKPIVVHSHPLRPQNRPNQVRYKLYVGYCTNILLKKIKSLLIRAVLVLATQPGYGLSNMLCYSTYLIGFGGI